jgi:hypothetical protein
VRSCRDGLDEQGEGRRGEGRRSYCCCQLGLGLGLVLVLPRRRRREWLFAATATGHDDVLPRHLLSERLLLCFVERGRGIPAPHHARPRRPPFGRAWTPPWEPPSTPPSAPSALTATINGRSKRYRSAAGIQPSTVTSCKLLSDSVCTPVRMCTCLRACDNQISALADCQRRDSFTSGGVDPRRERRRDGGRVLRRRRAGRQGRAWKVPPRTRSSTVCCAFGRPRVGPSRQIHHLPRAA